LEGLDASIEAFESERTVRQERGHDVRRRGHVRVSEDGQSECRRLRHQADSRAERRCDRSLGSDKSTRQRSAVLGQQMLERIAADLPAEATELESEKFEILADQSFQ